MIPSGSPRRGTRAHFLPGHETPSQLHPHAASLLAIPMVFIMLTLVFVVLRVMPGDPVSAMLGGARAAAGDRPEEGGAGAEQAHRGPVRGLPRPARAPGPRGLDDLQAEGEPADHREAARHHRADPLRPPGEPRDRHPPGRLRGTPAPVRRRLRRSACTRTSCTASRSSGWVSCSSSSSASSWAGSPSPGAPARALDVSDLLLDGVLHHRHAAHRQPRGVRRRDVAPRAARRHPGDRAVRASSCA